MSEPSRCERCGTPLPLAGALAGQCPRCLLEVGLQANEANPPRLLPDAGGGSPERWRQIQQLYHLVLEREPGLRGAYLAEACQGDTDLCREVESRLVQEGSMLAQPVWEGVGSQFDDGTAKQLVPGTQLGPYRIEAALGAGGMGEVYRARDSRLDRMVAIKLVRSQLAGRDDFRQRFQREARALAQLNHPNICTIHDVGPDFLVMEWLQGQTLKEKIGAGPLPLIEALDIVLQVGRGLEAAHERGILHRDIKPANIMMTAKGQVKVMDFGLAKFREAAASGGEITVTLGLTDAGRAMGTPSYMSPEQARGEAADERADIWSLGVVLYEMVSGRRPFRGESGLVVIRSILDDQPEPPSRLRKDLPITLDQIVAKALAKDPTARYQHILDLLGDLQAVREGQSIPGGQRDVKRAVKRKWMLGAAAALLVVLMALYWVAWRGSLPGFSTSPRIDSLAVLPLANLSGDPAQEFFADGMTDALTADLAQIGALRVISRTSIMQFKGTKKLLPEIARQLRVDAVVEGSVLRSGNRVRITAVLIDAATDRQLWAKTYERNMGDILDLQNEVARAVAGEIQARVTPQEQARLARNRAVNTNAYEAYLKGRYYWNNYTEEALSKSIEYFNQAIQLDPGYAAAYAGLANSWDALEYTGAAPPEEVHPKALEAASRALQLDDTLAEAHTAMATAKAREWDWAAAEREYKRALDLNPGSALTSVEHTNELRHRGRREESIAEGKRALDLDPLSPMTNEGLGDAYLSARQYDLAIEQYRKTLELFPNQSSSRNSLGWAYVYKGMYEQGIEEVQKSLQSGEDPNLSAELAYIYAVRGSKSKARDILERLRSLSKQAPVAPHHFVLIYTGLGEKDEAFVWLEKAYQQHSPMMAWLKVDPRFDNLRPDPRFQDLMRRVGLV